MTPRTAPRLAWLGAAAILVVAALVAVAAVLRGDFSETDGRILGTLAAVLYTGGAAFAGLANLERGRHAVGLFLVATAPVCFLLLLPAIWSVFDESGDDTVWRWAGSAAIVVLCGLLLGTALLMARTSASEVLAYATGALAGIAGTLTIAAIWAEPNADGWVQLIAALWILAVLGYVLVPLVGRFGRPAVPPTATHLPTRERVLATLDGVELVASTSGTVEPRLAPGEQLLLRRRTSV